MLENITLSDIEVGLVARDWRSALRASARHLVDTGKVEPGYVDAMVSTVERVGPYMVLCRQVALAHARPDGRVNELAVHFSTFDPGVSFGAPGCDPVRLVITLAAVDDTSHLDLMAELAGVLMHPEHVDALVAARSEGEFLRLLRRFAADEA